jgi:MFS family permease
MGLGTLSLILFILLERRAEDPIVDLSLFKNRVFNIATWSLFLIFVAYPVFILIMPFYLMQGIGLTPSAAGLLMAVTSMTSIFVGPISGWLSDRFGPAWFKTLGAGATVVSFTLMRGFDLQTQVTAIIPLLILHGVGIGMFQPPNNSTIMGAVARDRLGTASALIATLRQVGISLGMAMAGTVFSARRVIYQSALNRQGLEAGHSAKLSIPPAFQDVLLLAILIGSLVVLLSIIPGKKRA